MGISAKFVNPFIEAAMTVASKVAGITMRRGHLTYKRRPDPSYGVCIIIGVYGYLTGQVVYSMKRELADKMVEKMLQTTPGEDIDNLYLDALGELANMITGNATAILNRRKELALSITTPAIATGSGLNVTLMSLPTLALGLYSQFGPIEINVALRENEAAELEVSEESPSEA